ncbi:L-threonylcarbamoyladenylate synthase [Thermodesulfobacteriota bacterium]
MSHKIEQIDPQNPDPALISKAAGIIRNGGVVVFPTRGLYGLAANAFNKIAIERVFAIKQRPSDRPILILFQSVDGLDRLVQSVPPSAAAIMAHFWPGRITIVFNASSTLLPALTAGTGRIGVRLPGYSVALELVSAVGGPVTGTSANISGEVGFSKIDDIDRSVLDQADLVLDAGELKGGPGSTVIDVTVDPPEILREGAVPAGEIKALLEG